jgi:hypothetical protein
MGNEQTFNTFSRTPTGTRHEPIHFRTLSSNGETTAEPETLLPSHLPRKSNPSTFSRKSSGKKGFIKLSLNGNEIPPRVFRVERNNTGRPGRSFRTD